MQTNSATADRLNAAWLLSRLSDATGRDFTDASLPLNQAGIDSVDGLQVLGDLEDEFGITLELAHLLGGATADQVAARAQAELTHARSAPEYALTTAQGGASSPLTLQQERAVREAETSAAEGAAFRSHIALAFDVQGADAPTVAAAIRALVERHDALRLAFERIGDELAQRALPIGDWHVEHCEPDTLQERFSAAAASPFQLLGGPGGTLPLRALVCPTSPTSAILGIVVHHAVSDAASIAVLVEELGAHLDGSVLQPAASFARWAARTRGQLVEPPADWQRFERVLELTDAPVTRAAATVGQPLAPNVWADVERVAGTMNMTRTSLMCASFSLAAMAQARQHEAVVDVVSSRRAGSARRQLVGYLAENLAAPLHCSRETLRRIRGEAAMSREDLRAALMSVESQRQEAERSGWFRSSLDDARRRAGADPLPVSICFNAQPSGLVEGYRSDTTTVAPSLSLSQSAIQHCLGVIGYVLPAYGAAMVTVVYAPERASEIWCARLLERWVAVLREAGVEGW